MEILKANRQWSTRPADQRYRNLDDLYAATKAFADGATERTMPWGILKARETESGDIALVGSGNVPAKMTHYAFGQLALKVGAPADYLRELPAELAVHNLNHGLARVQTDGNRRSDAQLLLHTYLNGNGNGAAHGNGGNGATHGADGNGDGLGLLVRAVTTERYARIWDCEVVGRLRELEDWEPAVPDIRQRAENPETDTALYASDHDVFAFLRTDVYLREPGTDSPLWRGVIVENSEVGAAALKLTGFCYREMCGNHIIWGAQNVVDLSVRHIGNIQEKVQRWEFALQQYAQESASDEEALIARAQQTRIGATKEEVLDILFGNRKLGLGKKVLQASYDAVRPDEDGDPRTAWGLAQGITRHSQQILHQDKRKALDEAAGRLLAMQF